MRILLIAVPFTLLAACGGGDSGNAAADNVAGAANAANANAVQPAAAEAAATGAKPREADGAKPVDGAPAAAVTPPGEPDRAPEIAACVDDVRNEVPAGADVQGLCTCAVDRMRTRNDGERPALEACAAQMGIEPRR